MSKKLLVPSFATALVAFKDELLQRAAEVKQKAGEMAFDILTGGSTTVDTEKAISNAQGAVGAYEFAHEAVQALLQHFGVDGAIHLVIAGDLDSIVIGKPKNVPTMTLITSRDLHLVEGGHVFVQDKAGEFYVQIQSITKTEGTADVSPEFTYVAKILGTLTPGYVEATPATSTGRSSARKPAASNKPKPGNKSASKPAAKNPPRSRKPRGQKPETKPAEKAAENGSKNAEAASSQEGAN